MPLKNETEQYDQQCNPPPMDMIYLARKRALLLGSQSYAQLNKKKPGKQKKRVSFFRFILSVIFKNP